MLGLQVVSHQFLEREHHTLGVQHEQPEADGVDLFEQHAFGTQNHYSDQVLLLNPFGVNVVAAPFQVVLDQVVDRFRPLHQVDLLQRPLLTQVLLHVVQFDHLLQLLLSLGGRKPVEAVEVIWVKQVMHFFFDEDALDVDSFTLLTLVVLSIQIFEFLNGVVLQLLLRHLLRFMG